MVALYQIELHPHVRRPLPARGAALICQPRLPSVRWVWPFHQLHAVVISVTCLCWWCGRVKCIPRARLREVCGWVWDVEGVAFLEEPFCLVGGDDAPDDGRP